MTGLPGGEDTDSPASFFAQLGMYDVDPGADDLAIEMPVTPKVCNPRGGLQGGLIATLVDVVGGRAALTVAPPGLGVATADMSLHYLSAVTVGPARANARILRSGRRSVVVSVTVCDVGRDETAAVVATMTFAVMRPRTPADELPPEIALQN